MLMNSNEYLEIVKSIRDEIKVAQYKAAVSVNRELIMLYYNIGRVINEHKSWGNKFIDNLAADIKLSFPSATGYSVRNLKYMAKFAELYPDEEIVQATLAQITWYHNIALMDKVKDTKVALWYAEQTANHGWSRNVLVHQIESGLYERQVIADKISNFENRLASPQSELAVQTMKDPYVFDFIPFREDMVERDIEQALVQDITKLLLELGTGFAFLGNQYHINVGGDDFYIDEWDMERIVAYRKGLHWREYIELMEYITNRSTYWEVDFSEIEKLIELFVNSVKECKNMHSDTKECTFTPAYTFRICIGSKVLDVVCNEKVRKLKTYPGIFFAKNQNSMTIQFMIGDSTSQKNRISDSIFPPLKIFDGKTNFMGGNAYFEEISNFLTDQCGFMWIY